MNRLRPDRPQIEKKPSRRSPTKKKTPDSDVNRGGTILIIFDYDFDTVAGLDNLT